MTCEIVRDLIPMYLDGTASNETKLAIELHLAECSDCRRFKDACQRSDNTLKIRYRDKILSKILPGDSEISELDRQYARLSRRLKLRKARQTLIAIGILFGMAVYVAFDISRALKKAKNK